jgi:hypothetical protein
MFIANLFHPSPEIRYKQVLLYLRQVVIFFGTPVSPMKKLTATI